MTDMTVTVSGNGHAEAGWIVVIRINDDQIRELNVDRCVLGGSNRNRNLTKDERRVILTSDTDCYRRGVLSSAAVFDRIHETVDTEKIKVRRIDEYVAAATRVLTLDLTIWRNSKRYNLQVVPFRIGVVGQIRKTTRLTRRMMAP